MEAAEKRKILAIMLLVALFVAGSVCWSESRRPVGGTVTAAPVLAREALEKQKVVVSISGAVARPGIYRVEPDKRVNDVVALAGGFLPGADSDRVNIARRCYDGLHIEVREKRASSGRKAAPSKTVKGAAGALININRAGAAELAALPGIGPGLAGRIVAYRTQRGAFRTLAEIKQVNGIGDAKFAAIRGRLVL